MRCANFDILDLGHMPYAQAFETQQQRNQAVIDEQASEAIFLVEHPPVITISNRAAAKDHLIAPQSRLDELGITVEQTNRGGDITYHGPGQLVAYPIIRMADHGLNLSSYMRCLEQIIIDVLQHFDIKSQRDPDATGVWVPPRHSDDSLKQSSKICALGVRVRKNVTMHGLALNVTTDLTHFQTIVPCGLEGRPVTSMQQQLGDDCPDIETVKDRLVATMLNTWT